MKLENLLNAWNVKWFSSSWFVRTKRYSI